MLINFRHFPSGAFALAILAELGIVAVVALMLAGAVSSKPALSEPVPITLVSEEPAPPTPPAPPPPKPLPPVAMPKPQVQPKTKAAPQKPAASAAAVPTPEPAPSAPAPVAEAPTAFSEPVPTPPAPPPAGNKDAPNAEYAAKVKAAVQAAVVYPPAALALHFAGRVRVEFHLRDSVAGQARIVTASGVGMIDRAALASVQSASYPTPPADMQGKDHVYQVWVEFKS
ncbi:protein TonB [Collimonas sp. OK307]|uniref:energy transducer TonB n=1 Tax=Collimonas sp. OK307 TaxID=1801620 RepID=UPI0008E852EF|nr:energy transducer TonB [Collimonas sp. OK307]SFH70609.1 protein TonB [Collimonas sp. OK307]